MLSVLSINATAQLNYLFSAASKPYVPVTGGTSPHLVANNPDWEAADEGSARIPIGFTFKYDGENYTTANVHVNGFITLKPFLNIAGYAYFRNNLKAAPLYNERPVIAAFWDDLLLTDTLNLVYKTTGNAPFRVFTIEWKKVKWVYESVAPVLSIELKLYETSNIIEFHYKDEGSLPDARFAFASIGITSAEANREFISLLSTSAHPNISLLSSNDSLSVKPANNQLYRFIPSPIGIPSSLRSSLTYTNNKISMKLTGGGFGYYEYALTQSAIPPANGTVSFSPNITISSVAPSTSYYIYARFNFFGLLKSQWTCDSLTTAVLPAVVPWQLSGNVTGPSYLPEDVRIQNFMDTFYHFYPYSDADWQVITDFPNFGDTSVWALHTLHGFSANSWLFTPGMHMLAGKTYQLKFGYLSYSTQTLGEISSLEVKYGKATGSDAMTSDTLFNRNDIVTDFDEFGGINFVDTTIEISPTQSGAYYFGFHNLTQLNNGQPGPVLIIGNISLAEKTVSPTAPFVLSGKTINSGNVLNCTTQVDKTATGFELQSSADGIHFTKATDINSAFTDKKKENKNYTGFKVNRRTGTQATGYIKGKQLPVLTEIKPVIELKRADKKNAGSTISMSYTDHKTESLTYYRLQKTSKNGLTSYSNIVMLKKNKALETISVYPNPAADMLHIKLPAGMNNEITLQVTDILANKIISKSMQVKEAGTLVQLDISQLLPGIYFLKMTCANGFKSTVTKFVKQ